MRDTDTSVLEHDTAPPSPREPRERQRSRRALAQLAAVVAALALGLAPPPLLYQYF